MSRKDHLHRTAGLLLAWGACAWGATAGAAEGAQGSASPRWLVQSEQLGPYPSEMEPVASGDGSHYAFVTRNGAGWSVVLDGKAGPAFERIEDDSVVFSPDGKRLAYVASRASGRLIMVMDGQVGPEFDSVQKAVFSPDGRHYGYLARSKVRWKAVVDGKANAEITTVGDDALYLGGSPLRVLLFGSDDVDQWTAVLDGKRMGRYDAIQEGSGRISSDGRQVIFGARRGGRRFVVVNGQAGPEFEHISPPSLGPKGRHLFYVGKRGDSFFGVLDGRVGPPWEEIQQAWFTVDGRHISYLGRRGSRWTVLVDGVPGRQFDDVASYRMEPDPAHVAYVAREGKKWRSVVNGEVRAVWDDSPDVLLCDLSCWARAGREYGLTSLKGGLDERDSLVFSADGRRLARTARKGDRFQVLIDGKPGAEFLDLDPGSLIFSDDSKHLAYRARGNRGWSVVVDGEAGPELDSVERPWFRPDGSIVYFARDSARLLRIRHSLAKQ